MVLFWIKGNGFSKDRISRYKGVFDGNHVVDAEYVNNMVHITTKIESVAAVVDMFGCGGYDPYHAIEFLSLTEPTHD